MTTSVILIDDHELIRQGLRRAFERDPDFDVVGEAGSGGEAREKVQALTPDVVIVDVRLPDINGIDALSARCVVKVWLTKNTFRCAA